MAVYDRWHTKKPRLDDDGNPITCEHRKDGQPLYPSADHGCDKRWQVRWRDQEGAQRKRNFDKKAGKDPNTCADAFDKKIQGELTTGTYIDPTAGETTLADWAAKWRASQTGDPTTLQNLDDRLAHIYEMPPREGQRKSRRIQGASPIAHRSMAELAARPLLVQQWVKHLEGKGLAPQYVRHIVATLSSVFLAAIDNGVVTRNPVASKTVRPPKVLPKHVTPWTVQQIEAAADHLGNAMPYLGAGGGLRGSEIFAFAEDDIDAGEGVIRIRRQTKVIDGVVCFTLPKRDKIRDAPLSDELADRLERQIKEQPPVAVTLPWGKPDGDPVTVRLLFTRPDGRAIHRQSFSYDWQAARAAAGAPPTRENGMHVLRATFASACLSEGVDIRTLSEWLGHTDASITLKYYAHLMPSAAGRGRKAIDKFLRGCAPDVPSQ